LSQKRYSHPAPVPQEFETDSSLHPDSWRACNAYLTPGVFSGLCAEAALQIRILMHPITIDKRFWQHNIVVGVKTIGPIVLRGHANTDDALSLQ
jgi:hypothetical protein